MRTLLTHVLTVVKETPGIKQTIVVSSDPAVWQIAHENDAASLAEKMPYDLNLAVTYASNLAMQRGAQAVLVLPADLPFVTAADISLMLYAGSEAAEDGDGSNGIGNGSTGGRGQPVMAICPDLRGSGTNALFLQPAANFEFHYGAGSVQRHVREAFEWDYQVCLVNAAGLQFDLDTEDDWHTFLADERGEIIKDSQFRLFVN